MFCPKCGFQVPDGSANCSNCGTPLSAPQAAPVAPAPVVPAAPVDPATAPVPAAAPVAQPAAPKNPIPFDVGGFLKEFKKSPVDACIDKAESKFWLLGLLFPVVYLVIGLIFKIINDDLLVNDAITLLTAAFGGKKGPSVGGLSFSLLIVEAISIAAFMFFFWVLSKPFGVKKTDFLSVVSWSGLAFFPYAVAALVKGICDLLYIAMDYKVFNFAGVFTGIALLFLIFVAFEYAQKNLSETATKAKAMWLVIATSAISQAVYIFVKWIVFKMLF